MVCVGVWLLLLWGWIWSEVCLGEVWLLVVYVGSLGVVLGWLCWLGVGVCMVWLEEVGGEVGG